MSNTNPKPKRRRTASYRRAIEWIAHNDEGGEMDVSVIETFLTVGLVADIWNRTDSEVAEDVLRLRKRIR